MPEMSGMAGRISALHGRHAPGRMGAMGADGQPGVVLGEIRGLRLHQIAAWPGTLDGVGAAAARAAEVTAAPGPGMAVDKHPAEQTALLRVEPMKWWLLGAPPPQLAPEQGAILDLSHSRTRVRITGRQAAAMLGRHLPLDLRPASFPENAVASSALHHVGVTLWRSRHGYELFIPRGFALSVWEVLLQTAAQFGAEIASNPATG